MNTTETNGQYFVLTNGTDAVNRRFFTSDELDAANNAAPAGFGWSPDTVQTKLRPSFNEVSPI